MAKLTPSIDSIGRYTVKFPWTINANALFTCKAIRSFDSIYKLGQDVYQSYYVPYGATNGVLIDGVPFDFEKERLLEPNIITLMDSAGSVYYIPDTFIATIPDQTDISYSQRVLAVSLGPLPGNLDISNFKADLQDLITSKLGIANPQIIETVAPLTDNPTYEESLVMERTRKASITNNTSQREQLVQQQREIARLNRIIQAYESKLGT